MAESWGRYPAATHSAEFGVAWRSEAAIPPVHPVLPFGRGRSYGDCCLNDGGALLRTAGLDRFISLSEDGILRCEAGVTLGQILALAVPRGFFLPVLPGTKFVSVGGAIANDIHGKNHHRAGTFGRHVRRLELVRSDGRVECAPGDELFAATVGGLGLTGLVTWAEIALRPVPGPAMRTEAIPFAGLDEFFAISDESDARFEYTVAWLDVLSPSHRGIFFRGEHAEGSPRAPLRPLAAVPFDAPVVNGLTVRAFNAAYFAAQKLASGARTVHYDPFFFPLDAVDGWNRLYGPRGLLQFQCVVPSPEAVRALLDEAARSGGGSPLTVLKRFGDVQSPGMMSFPRPGFTVAIDFPNSGDEAFARVGRLEALAMEAGGALYPAKDARMSAATFARSYPRRAGFEPFIDPAFSSSFWRRVSA